MYYVLCCVQVYHLSSQTIPYGGQMYKCNYTCVNYLNHLATTSVCQMYSPCTICINTSSVLALYYLYNYWPAWCESGVQMLNPFNYLCTGELPEPSVNPVAASCTGVQNL